MSNKESINKTKQCFEESFRLGSYYNKQTRDDRHLELILSYIKVEPSMKILDLGTGSGYSGLDIVNTFNKVNGNLVSYKFTERRAGDIAICYADTTKAKNELNFVATHTLQDMCKSSYEFEKNNK